MFRFDFRRYDPFIGIRQLPGLENGLQMNWPTESVRITDYDVAG